MNLYNKLVSEAVNYQKLTGGDVCFVYEVSKNIEITVNVSKAEIVVKHYKGKLLEPIKTDNFLSLYGMFDYPSTEEKFNEIVNELN